MSFCVDCGNKLNGGAFCTKCGKPIDGNSANQTAQPKRVYEEFTVMMSFGPRKRFVFTENSLIYGDDKYLYSKLSRIILASPPSMLSDGEAQAATVDGQTLSLYYGSGDKERLVSVVTYANEQIDLAHGVKKNHKFLLQSPTGSKVEVFDDYLTLYHISTVADGVIGQTGEKVGGLFGKAISGIGNIGKGVSNAVKSGGTSEVLMFTELSAIKINMDNLIINDKSIPLRPQDIEIAKQIIAYIQETLKEEKADTSPISEIWEPIKATDRKFPLFGHTLDVPKNLDAHNSYKLQFREFAMHYASKASDEYTAKVHDLTTYIKFFPIIYMKNLEPLIQKAVDILIAEQVWTITFDSLKELHLSKTHNALNDYQTTVDNIKLTSEANQRNTASLTSLIPNVAGFGFGLKGAVKAIAGAQIFNVVRDGIEDSLIRSASSINPAQQHELYSRIDKQYTVSCIYLDYMMVFFPLIKTLKENGQDIWFKSTNQQANNIFQNLTNPNFPQENVLNAMLQLLKTNPYNADYYKFLISRHGETDEVKAIKNYFGLLDLDNPLYCF